MNNSNCGICNAPGLVELFSKPSKDGKLFRIYRCMDCDTVQVYPLPSQSELDSYYSSEYFTKRTDRGYDNYYSNAMKSELRRVWKLNLMDLGVYEDIASNQGRSLDIGCAAGFYVDYMRELGWDACGIEIATEPIRYGRDVLGLNIYEGDFLNWDIQFQEKFRLITLWASIEHMRDPLSILKKIRGHLDTEGIVLVSTCRWGIQSRWRRESWRFLNVPEHLFYFGWKNFTRIMKNLGYEKIGGITYGSGFTTPKNPSRSFLLKKMFFDRLVKATNQGDMMAIAFRLKS